MVPVIIEISIDELAWGGDGVGRAAGKVVFAPLVAPGDKAEIEILTDRRSYSRGRLVRLVKASPVRVDPPCPLFGVCGGCQWQHVAYQDQLAAKSNLVTSALWRIGRLKPAEPVTVIASPQTFGYRHRARLHCRSQRGRRSIGFFRTGSHSLVPVEHCPTLADPLNTLLPSLHSALEKGSFARVDIQTIGIACDFAGSQIRISLRGRGGRHRFPASLAKEIIGSMKHSGLKVCIPGLSVEPLALGPGPEDLLASGDTFTQVNLRQNRNLVREVLSLAHPEKGDGILDLFCGIGNFSLPAAAAGAEVLGIERDGPAVSCARDNAARLGMTSLHFHRRDALAAAISLAREGRRFDTIILNPPRSGCSEVVRQIPALHPRKVVMVSCDPATFARDAALLREGGFHLADLKALDLFPQTYHVETVALFLA